MYWASINNNTVDNLTIEDIKRLNPLSWGEMKVGENYTFSQFQELSKNVFKKDFNKLFCIGFNKTGTTSLEYYFRALNYRLPNQQDQERKLVENCYSGNFEVFKEFVQQYDVFQDMPFSQEDWFIVADTLFPNSKFILTVRDEDSWYKSYINFHKDKLSFDTVDENFFKNNNTYLYEGYIYKVIQRQIAVSKDYKLEYDWSQAYNKESLVKLYNDRNTRIMTYFANRNNLLIVDLSKETTTEKIVNFLNLDRSLICAMPHVNKGHN